MVFIESADLLRDNSTGIYATGCSQAVKAQLKYYDSAVNLAALSLIIALLNL